MTTVKEYTAATLKAIKQARSNFERSTGKTIANATSQDIEAWMMRLRDMGMAVNTCRTYLSLVKKLVDIEAQAPKRAPTVKRVLSEEEALRLLSVSPEKDRSWLAVSLLVGPECMGWTWGRLYEAESIIALDAYFVIVEEAQRRGMATFENPYRGNLQAHWVGGYDRNELIWDVPQHEINRRLKGMARRAGIGAAHINSTALRYTHQALVRRYGNAAKISKALGVQVVPGIAKPVRKDSRLYGIGRRSPAFVERGS